MMMHLEKATNHLGEGAAGRVGCKAALAKRDQLYEVKG